MYCPACAAPIETGSAVCLKCGEPVVPIAAPPVRPENPPSVRIAGRLLWITIAIGLCDIAYVIVRYGSAVALTPSFLFFGFLEMAAWIAAVVLTLRRNNAARVVLLLLVAFSVLNTLRNMVMTHSLSVDFLWLLELGMRVAASYFLLRPESNAWFRARPVAP